MPLVKTMDIADISRRFAAWLKTALPDAREFSLTHFEAAGGSGMSSSTILADATWHDGHARHEERLVLRLSPRPEHRLFMQYDLERERTMLDLLREKSVVPVPHIRFIEHSPDILGSPFLVMDRVDGRVPRDDPPYTVEGWVLDLPKEDQSLLCENGLKTLRDIHDAALSAADLTRLFALPDLRDPLGAHLDWWEQCYAWSGNGEPNAIVDAGIAWLRANRPAAGSERTVLCWGDSRIGNMIFRDDLSIAAVLDWEMAFVGSPEVDLGWWLFLLRFHTDGFGASLPPGCPDLDTVVARYEVLSGEPVRHRKYYEIFGGVRQAILSVRAAQLMIDAAILPPETRMAHNNPVTRILAGLLDMPAPEAEGLFRLAAQQ